MAEGSRAWIELWPVALLAVAAPAVPIGFNLSKPPPPQKEPRGDYPIRIELSSVRPATGNASAPRMADVEPAVMFELPGSEAEGDGRASMVEIRKAVRLNGAEAGSATIRVGANSTLSIAADELRALLTGAERAELAAQTGAWGDGERFIGFEEMRAQGVDVRYDVATDTVVITA